MTDAPVLATVRRRVFYVIVACLGVVGFIIAISVGSKGITAAELQTKLIVVCESSRSPLVAYYQGEMTDEISQVTQTATSDPALFPDIPPAKFSQLIASQMARELTRVARLRTLIVTYDPARCANQYR